MSPTLAVAAQHDADPLEKAERDAARARGQLLTVVGAGHVAAVANSDFRAEVRRLLRTGTLDLHAYVQLELVLDDELEDLSDAAERMLDEDLRAVLP